MKPTASQLKVKKVARKNATPSFVISDGEGSDCDIFINDEARRKFSDSISKRGIFAERGFLIDRADETLGHPESISSLIINKSWEKLCQHPSSYNTQLVKEFYSNLRLPSKKSEVMVRGSLISYSEGTINMMFGLKATDGEYEETLLRADDTEYEVYMQTLCQPHTTWVEKDGEKSVRRMDLLPEAKAWYQFIKHSIRPTTHNETVNKSRLALFHCFTAGCDINFGKIIMQEIQLCATKKEGMLYYPCLITSLCMRQGVRARDTDEIGKP